MARLAPLALMPQKDNWQLCHSHVTLRLIVSYQNHRSHPGFLARIA